MSWRWIKCDKSHLHFQKFSGGDLHLRLRLVAGARSQKFAGGPKFEVIQAEAKLVMVKRVE